MRKNSPETFLLNAMAKAASIEASERRGQAALCSSREVPVKGSEILVALGFALGETGSDRLFISATWPAGWAQRATDHAMWSNIVDAKGRKRAGVFYKAAFYDRRAFVSGPQPRFDVDVQNGKPGSHDFDAMIWTPRVVDYGLGPERQYKAIGEQMTYEGARSHVFAWLDANRPQWTDAAAYWDDDAANL
jgi:hypothetical protein